MKKTFPGHFPPEDKDIDRLWGNCVFTFDTNILLNLYRYSDSTRSEFIKVMRALKDRLWLPHRAAQEYFENRLIVIAQQEKAYDEALKTIQALQTDLSNVRQHPFLSDKLMQKLTQVLGEAVGELTTTKSTHANRTSSDKIQNVIGDLFNGRVGSAYSEEQLDAIFREGENRYARKVPPGYKDDSKDDGASSPNIANRKYGDLVIWHQLIEHAAQTKKSVIFINDDKKVDWYLISRGKTLGPRPELIEEFLSKTGQSFHMYQADRFFEYAAKHLEHKITPESMDEIREIRDLRKRDLDRHVEVTRRQIAEINHHEQTKFREEMSFREEEAIFRARISDARERMEASRVLMDYLREKALQLQHGQAVYQEKLDRSGSEDKESLERLLDIQRQAANAERELAQTREEMRAMESEYAMEQHRLTDLQKTTGQRFARARG